MVPLLKKTHVCRTFDVNADKDNESKTEKKRLGRHDDRKKEKKRDMQVEKGSDKQCFILRQRLCKTERKAIEKTALETHSNDVIIALSAPTGLWDR